MPVLAVMREHSDYVLLLFLRVSGILIGSPVFGRKNVPSLSKIGFCAVLTLVFMAGSPAPREYPVYGHLLEYVLLCLRELLFGAAMGFVLTAMFSISMTAGSMIDYQIGFNMASIYDAQSNMLSPLSGSLLNLMLLVMFFSVDGHLKLINILYRTVEAVPVGTAVAAPGIVWAAAEVMSKSFVLSVMVAMPVLAAGMMLEVALGATIKTVPQMNMFVVGIPLKIIIGLVVLALTLTVFADVSNAVFTKAFDYIGMMFEYLGSAQ
jgi:flagellar biosynthetic protein FliR